MQESLLAALQNILGGRATNALGAREAHGRSESYFPVFLPDAVVFPESTLEVAEIVKICASESVPIIGFGAWHLA